MRLVGPDSTAPCPNNSQVAQLLQAWASDAEASAASRVDSCFMFRLLRVDIRLDLASWHLSVLQR